MGGDPKNYTNCIYEKEPMELTDDEFYVKRRIIDVSYFLGMRPG